MSGAGDRSSPLCHGHFLAAVLNGRLIPHIGSMHNKTPGQLHRMKACILPSGMTTRPEVFGCAFAYSNRVDANGESTTVPGGASMSILLFSLSLYHSAFLRMCAMISAGVFSSAGTLTDASLSASSGLCPQQHCMASA